MKLLKYRAGLVHSIQVFLSSSLIVLNNLNFRIEDGC